MIAALLERFRAWQAAVGAAIAGPTGARWCTRRIIGWPADGQIQRQDGSELSPVISLSNWLRGSSAPDFVIGVDYIHRWWVLPRNPLFNIYLHKIMRSDDDRALHDHPWENLSILLSGDYIEVVPDTSGLKTPYTRIADLPQCELDRFAGDLVFRFATDSHRLVIPDGEGPVWSLFLTGPTRRDWGFHCPHGWRHYREFTDANDRGRTGPGCG